MSVVEAFMGKSFPKGNSSRSVRHGTIGKWTVYLWFVWGTRAFLCWEQAPADLKFWGCSEEACSSHLYCLFVCFDTFSWVKLRAAVLPVILDSRTLSWAYIVAKVKAIGCIGVGKCLDITLKRQKESVCSIFRQVLLCKYNICIPTSR